jgi:hypothetical protein
MNHIFCSNCGNKIQYNLAKPNFCTKCGSSLSSIHASEAVISETKTLKVSKVDVDLEEDETDVDGLPNLKKIAVDIENFSENSSFTLGNLFGTPTQAFKGRKSRSVDEFIDEKKA